MEEHLDPRLFREMLPKNLQHLLVVGDPGSGAVRVGTFEGHAGSLQALDHFPPDATDHPPRLRAGRKEGVEGVEHSRRCPPEERQAIDEQCARAQSRSGDRGGAAGGP